MTTPYRAATSELERELKGLYKLRTESPVPLSDADNERISTIWRELDYRYKTGDHDGSA